MSLQSLQFISDYTAPGKDSLLTSLYSQASAGRQIVFRNDINAAVYYPLTPSSDSTRFWDGVVIPTDKLLLGIGTGEDLPPTGGTWDGAYDGDSTGLADLDFEITAAALQTALNANTTIAGLGGVTVALLSTGVYQVTFVSNGARELIEGDPAGLSPQSNVFVSRYVTGDASTKEVQIIQLVQRPYVYVSSWAYTADPTAILTTVSNGGVSAIASYIVTLTGELYDGTFSLTLDAQEYAIPFNAQATTFNQLIGEDWVVSQVSAKQWAIQAAANGSHTASVDGANLIAYTGLIGTLAFNATSLLLAFLQTEENEIEAFLQVRYVDGTTERDTLLFVPVTITRDVLSAAAIAPTNWNQFYYTAAQVDAIIAILSSYSTDTSSAAEEVEITKDGPQTKYVYHSQTTQAGAGAYQVDIVLSNDDCSAGDRADIAIIFPASANPTVDIFSGTSGGTALTSDTNPSATVNSLVRRFVHNGTDWLLIPG